MTGLVPLLFMWLWSRSSGGAPVHPAMPAWPTPQSPPPLPPIPAFQSQPPPAPSADTSHSSTPLAELHAAPPEVTPASATATTTKKARSSPAAKAKAAAVKAAKSKAKGAFSVPLPSQTKTVTVLAIQKIVNARGIKLAKDGMYGPKTANAWATIANAKGLPPTITRGGPKIAKVVPRTYDALSVPPIP